MDHSKYVQQEKLPSHLQMLANSSHLTGHCLQNEKSLLQSTIQFEGQKLLQKCLHIKKKQKWVIPEKIHTPPTDGILF